MTTPAPFTSIVVGVDATLHDRPIVEWISNYAAKHHNHVIAAHVVARTTLWLIAGAQADSTRYLETIRDQLERHVIAPLRANGISAELRLALGDPAQQLADIAVRSHAELLVLGGPEHSALHDVVLGGIIRRLEHRSDIPVVVVPRCGSRIHART